MTDTNVTQSYGLGAVHKLCYMSEVGGWLTKLLRFPENEAILDGHGNYLMPATPIFPKHYFFKKGPKNLTN